MRTWIVLITLSIVVCLTLILNTLLPPKTIVMASGPQGGAYTKVARQYAHILARDGIVLERLHTNGSAENAELLASGKVDAAFLQAGIQIDPTKAESIGGVFFEPMLFLTRTASDIENNPALWKGLRIASGLTGSGTAEAFRDFQLAVGLDYEANTHISLTYQDAVDALEKGDIDLAVFVTTIDAPYLRRAYSSNEISILHLSYVDAISRHMEYADVAIIPNGAVSLNPLRPPYPETVLALQARLAISPDLHPAMVNRLTMAAIEVHSSRSIITDRGEFPTTEGTGLQVNNIARQLIQEGPSTWHNLLPYWMAAQINRVLLLILPILLVLVPMLRLVPKAYAYFRGWQVWQHYPQIRKIEDQLADPQKPASLDEMDAQLTEVDQHIANLKLPSAYRQAAYEARMHIELVRSRIKQLADENTPPHSSQD